ncbi:MAG TPA: DUF4157 domain-containing protein [Longimicrobiaceae bacterium]
MSFHQAPAPAAGGVRLRTSSLAVQRACACGNHAPGGECEKCRRKKLLQRKSQGTDDLSSRAMGSRARTAGSGPGPDLSRVAARSSAAGPALRTVLTVQRQPLDAAPTAPEARPAASAEPTAEPAPSALTPGPSPVAEPAPGPEAAQEPAGPTAGGPLIAEDNATDLQPGQLRKSEFLDQLQSAVCAEADAALAAAGRSTAGCPYLAGWFDYYRGQSAAHVEAALRRYAPETRSARSAAEYVPLVVARVRSGVERWVQTGEITGVPDDLPMAMPGMGGLAAGMGAVASAVGGLMFKAADGGVRAADDPAAVQQALGPGRPLESGVRMRMERAFGQSFAGVRTHTDAVGRRLSAEQHARAFTVGSDIAFGSGEYRPGTPVGDALIAHELAHVVQQRGASPEARSKGAADSASYGALERDADEAALGAVAALWSGTSGALARAAAGLRSGLRISRCASQQTAARAPASPAAAGAVGTRLSCPASTTARSAGTTETAAPAGRLDPRAQAIVAIAQDESQPIEQRAVTVVTRIICEYFPADAEKVSGISYQADLSGLDVTTVRDGTTIRGHIRVGRYFVEHADERGFARRVLQTQHELQHIEQWRSGMTGEANQAEREFLAFHREALAAELPGTGRVSHSTRVALIDAALGYYHCLNAEKQAEHRARRDELLQRRPVEVRASGRAHPEPPTACRRQEG